MRVEKKSASRERESIERLEKEYTLTLLALLLYSLFLYSHYLSTRTSSLIYIYIYRVENKCE